MRQIDATATVVFRQMTKMVARVFWILPALAVAAYARGIWVPDFQNLYTLGEEGLQIEPYVFEDKILEVIYKLKNLLKYGDHDRGIPPFDPFFLPYKEFDFILKDTALSGYLQNVTFTDFSAFEPDAVELRFLPLHFKLDLGIDRFQIDGRYKIQGKIVDDPVVGIGQFVSEVKNLTVCLYLRLTTVNDFFQIKDFIFEFKTLSVKLNYTNELYSDQFQLMDEGLILYILDQVQENYIPPLLNTAKILLNRFLLGYTAADVLTFVMNLLHKE